uniref:INTS3 and NABP interacting protein n=2 Tax=Canis lupus familiaris TaxID=9615 RepID=A0A8C0SU79_CANLF
MQNQSSTNHPGASMHMHTHLDTSLKTLHLGILFFPSYLALTQNEENICNKVT